MTAVTNTSGNVSVSANTNVKERINLSKQETVLNITIVKFGLHKSVIVKSNMMHSVNEMNGSVSVANRMRKSEPMNNVNVRIVKRQIESVQIGNVRTVNVKTKHVNSENVKIKHA